MKTIQKTIWMHYLLIGLFVSLLPIACTKARIEYLKDVEHVYINETNYTITFPKGTTTITIKPHETIAFKLRDGSNKNVDENSYNQTPNPFDFIEQYKIIKFDDLKCLDLSKLEVNNPAYLRYYKAERLGKRSYRFTFTFTEADYNRAITCP